MNLSVWLKRNDIDPGDGLCMCLATDGLAGSNIVGISCVSRHKEMQTILVRSSGADPEKTYKYHGIEMDRWNSEAVGPKRARELLSEIVEDNPFVVVKDFGFFNSFLMRPELELLMEYFILDLTGYLKYRDRGLTLSSAVNGDIDDLNQHIDSKIQDGNPYQQGYSFPSIYSRITGKECDVLEESILETRTRQLYEVYLQLLLI